MLFGASYVSFSERAALVAAGLGGPALVAWIWRGDIGGTLGTREVGDYIADAIRQTKAATKKENTKKS